MNRRKRLSALVACSIAFSAYSPFASAASQKISLDGIDTVFVSSFGKVRYGDNTYSSVKTFEEAAKELSETGGRIIMQGAATIAEFPQNIVGSLSVEGAGSAAKGNKLILNQSEISLACDTSLAGVVVSMPENGVIHTNGHALSTGGGFDSYSVEKYVENGANTVTYPAPISVGVSGGSTASLSSGYYKAVFTENGSGRTHLSLSDVTVDSLTFGSESGSGIVAELYGKTTVKSLTLRGKTDGDIVVCMEDGVSVEQYDRTDATLTGKAYAAVSKEQTVPEHFFDAVWRISDGKAFAEYAESGDFLGFRLYDRNGFITEKALVNGKTLSPENGLFFPTENADVTPIEAVHIAPRTESGYIAGYSDGTFRPQNNITRAEAITTLSRLIADETEIRNLGVSAHFSDVSDDAWFRPYIALFSALGYLDTLETDGNVLPARSITRGEFCELIMQIYPLFSEKLLFPLSFPDVTKDYPYKDSVEKAAFAGIVTGYEDRTFRPDSSITRAEAVTMLNRLLSRVPTDNSAESFRDIDSHWAKAQITAASNTAEKDGTVMWTTEKKNQFDMYMQYRYSLANTAYKLNTEKKLNVAFIGGSVTAGAGASLADQTSWRARTVEWFRRSYPNCEINQVNAAIGDSYTKYAVYRMDADLLAYDYDLVFVEYAINDSSWYSAESDMETIVYFETLIRRIYEHNPNADIVIVYTIDDKLDRTLPYFSTAAAQEKIAKLYDIPSVNFGRALANYIGDNGYKWADYFSDYVHPNDVGYTYYAAVLTEYLENALNRAESPSALVSKVLPEPSAKKLWYNLTMLEAKEIDLSESKNWALSDDGKYIVPTSDDNELVLKTVGTDLCIAAPRADVMEYSIDGGEVKTMSMNRKPQTLGKNMADGKHVLKIHAPDHTKLRIQRLMYNG